MNIYSKIVFSVYAVLCLAGCSKSRPEQMRMADNVKIVCTPEVLSANGNSIPVQISITYPKGYFHPQVMMNVTPVLVYEGGSQMGPTFTYQGDGIRDNYEVVSSKGGSVLEKMEFVYTAGVEKSYLELRSVVFYGGKRIEIPTVRIADGCIVTSRMADVAGACRYKDDGYKQVIRQLQEGQIMYDVNSAEVKRSQLRSESISDMKDALNEIEGDERYRILGTQVIAYASPEGGQKLNSELSDKRAASAKNAWKGLETGIDVNALKVLSVGQDWEGFQEAVRTSNIQDKELILRVLSMYDDPAVREREIRNLSEIFTEINKKVFPVLRRARFVTEVEYQNYTDEELEKIANTALGILDEPALLRVASNAADPERKARIYQLAADKFDSQTALYNLAALKLNEGHPAVAELELGKLKDGKDPDAINLRGIIELQRGNYENARKLFGESGSAEARQNLGTLDILEGKYEEAASLLAGTGNANEGLAFLLNGRYDEAAAALAGGDERSAYLRAVLAARKGDREAVEAYLVDVPEGYRAKAATDIEFARYR